MDEFAYLMWRIVFKKLDYDRDTNKLRVKVVIFVMMRVRFVTN
jgi:hypothetical protein